MKIFKEIHRRSLWQILGLYVALSWLALQVVGTLGETIGVPDWFAPVAVALLIIGLPMVLMTAFVQRGGPTRAAMTAKPFADPSRTAPEPAAGEGSATQAPEAVPGAVTPAGHHRLFTWRNAIAGGVLAFALLGVGAAGWMAMRTLGIGPAGTLVAKGVMEERDRILLADFDNLTPDSLLARTVTEALRVDLAQSQVVRLADPAAVSEALQRMARPADDPLTGDLAREIAQREGIKAVLTGEIGQAGDSYIVTAQLIVPETGEILVSEREAAGDGSDVIRAVDDLSASIRERVGESLRTIAAEPPLERVTTSDFEALQRYTQALYALEVTGEVNRALALLSEAVEADTAFAMAWRKLGMQLWNMGEDRAGSVQAMTQAYEHRDRLTDSERYLAIAGYHEVVTGELDQAITAYENLLDIDPEADWALTNMGVTYREMGEFQQYEAMAMRAVAIDSSFLGIQNLATAQHDVGEVEEAKATLDLLAELYPEAPQRHAMRFWSASATGDYEAAEAYLDELRTETAGDPLWQFRVAYGQAGTLAARGRLAEAEVQLREAMQSQADRGLAGAYLFAGAEYAELALVGGDGPEAVRRLDAALTEQPLDDLESLDRPYLALAEVFARAGEPGRARALLDAHTEAQADLPLTSGDRSDRHRVQAYLALADGRAAEAIDEFRASDFGFCQVCPYAGLAAAYEAAGQPAEAIAAREAYLGATDMFRLGFGLQSDRVHRGPMFERLGQLYDARGDLEKAAEYYARFVELWAVADEELQPRVAAAQARLQEIVEARG